MKKIKTFEFTGDKNLYNGRELEVRKNDVSFHFFEVNKEGYPEFSKELGVDTIKWCAENGKLPGKIRDYLQGDENNNDNLRNLFHYKGKSKKLTSNTVMVLKETDTRYKVQDMDGNITSVAKSQLIKK